MFPKTLLTPRDLLVPAGTPASLEVEVERRFGPFLDPALPGVEVDVEGVGRAPSDAGGDASIPLGVLAPGDHRFRVRAAGREAEALVRVLPHDAPVLVTDVDGTIADVSPVGFILRPMRSVRPTAGAPEVLEELSRRMSVLYLTARDHIFIPKTKAWLRYHGFPEGPVYARRRTRFWTVPARDHKRERLAELRPRFTNVIAGVGDLLWDMEAYASHGIPPIFLGTNSRPDLPPGTRVAPTWSRILDMIK